MNQFLAAAPNATVAHGAIACVVQVNDLADRPPRPLAAGEVLDLGGRRVRNIDTPHIPHGWDAHVLYEETTRTLFCGDLFTRFGESPATTSADIVEAALEGEAFGSADRADTFDCADDPSARRSRRRHARPDARTHVPGDCAKALSELADGYEHMFAAASVQVAAL